MSQERISKKQFIAIAAGAAVATALIPSSEGTEPEWLKLIQRKVGTRREWQPLGWPNPIGSSRLLMDVKRKLDERCEALFAYAAVTHPPG